MLPALLQNIITTTNNQNFVANALAVFNYQYANNTFYRTYCDTIKVNAAAVNSIEKIPFLPIQFFKSKIIKTTDFETEIIFESSGTTGSINSRHYVKDVSIYEKSFINSFKNFYGNSNNYCIIGLLPSYLERKGSSLVYMVNDLIQKSDNKDSGFYLYDYEKLKTVLIKNEIAKQPTILIGVTYALIDFAEQYSMKLNHTIVMETRSEELV